MKLLIVGAWRYPMYEDAFAKALTSSGHDVKAFSWSEYFRSFAGRVEEKYSLGAIHTRRFNRELLEKVRSYRPNIVLTWRATSIFPATLEAIKRTGVEHVASYNHDDFTGPSVGAPVPFHHHLHWRLFLSGAKYYDHHFVKRLSNIEHLESLGSRHNVIMPMWFIPDLHRPIELDDAELKRFGCDIVFVGHYEPDERVNYLRALVSAGLSVKLFGGEYWTEKVLGNLYRYFFPIMPAEGDDYSKALCGAKVCLTFLSKINRDTYTRRCFEIPACGRVMLAERTDDLSKLFEEDKEACFFSTTDELVAKARWLVENPSIRERIAQSGMRRVWADGHDITNRVAWFMRTVTGEGNAWEKI